MRKIRTLLVVLVILLILPAALSGRPAQGQTDLSEQILDELRQVRRLLEELVKTTKPQPAPVSRLTIELGEAPVLGDRQAPLTVVEFTDYQCPYCQRFHLATFPLLKRDFIDSGKVRFVHRDLPLTELHPYALRAAQAARCAGDQGQFWPLRDQLQRSSDALALTNLMDYAGALKLNISSFRECVEKEKFRAAVEEDARDALAKGISATPSFVIGRSAGTEMEGEIVSGAIPYEVFSAKLKALSVVP